MMRNALREEDLSEDFFKALAHGHEIHANCKLFLRTHHQNVDKAKFSIYIHSEPGYVFDESTTRSPSFFNRQLKNSIKK
ncbi:hypothetical protein CASFOL_022128 [Castilleja foliolosa]|uniref:Uncharacterized protein n=1 Tax=Castilleja foliolosa TaxID=1961234 RepID=A0ABD3D187_9LAMI